uniref:Uncharacterized protein n=1 Tax=Syphacia muris TaxID=451379 RepID=A0A0N5ATV0_9BILA
MSSTTKNIQTITLKNKGGCSLKEWRKRKKVTNAEYGPNRLKRRRWKKYDTSRAQWTNSGDGCNDSAYLRREQEEGRGGRVNGRDCVVVIVIVCVDA